MAAYFDDHVLETGLTYSGHPLACAAGVAAIRAYRDEGLIERAAALGAWMFDRLRDWQAHQPLIVDVRGKGLFAVVECAGAQSGAPAPPFPQPLPWLRQAARAALARGVSLAVRGNLLILSPPLVIEHSDLAWALDVVEEEFAKLPEQGR